MPDNKYISRYCAGETRFRRYDATPHIPIEDTNYVLIPRWEKVLFGALCLAWLGLILAA